MTWQPIETAPRNAEGQLNGPYVLLWCKNDHAVRTARWTAQVKNIGPLGKTIEMVWQSADWLDLTGKMPTHWMPLPAPPEAEIRIDELVA